MEDQIELLARSVSRADGLENLVRPMLGLLHRISGLESTYLTTVDQIAGKQSVLFSTNSGELVISEGLEVPWGDSLCERALRENRWFANDVAQRWHDSSAAQALGIQTYLSAPIYIEGDQLYGTLCGASCHSLQPDQGVHEGLTLFAEVIARQVEREKRAETAEQRAHYAEVRADIGSLAVKVGRLCMAARQLRPTVSEVGRMLLRRRPGAWVVPFFMEHNVPVTESGGDGELVPLIEELLSREAHEFVGDNGGFLEKWYEELDLPTEWRVELIRAENEQGIQAGILLLWEEHDLPLDVLHDLFESCSNMLSLLAARLLDHDRLERANRELKTYAMHDVLTGLPNRRYLLEELERTLPRAQRMGEAVHVLFVDLDDFKQLNDTYGHETGDQFLVAIAQRLSIMLRSGDLASRLGGDEFVLVAPGGSIEKADQERACLTHRIEEALTGQFSLGSLTIDYGGPSVGGISCIGEDMDPAQVLADADRAMYQVKKERRQRHTMPRSHQ